MSERQSQSATYIHKNHQEILAWILNRTVLSVSKVAYMDIYLSHLQNHQCLLSHSQLEFDVTPLNISNVLYPFPPPQTF